METSKPVACACASAKRASTSGTSATRSGGAASGRSRSTAGGSRYSDPLESLACARSRLSANFSPCRPHASRDRIAPRAPAFGLAVFPFGLVEQRCERGRYVIGRHAAGDPSCGECQQRPLHAIGAGADRVAMLGVRRGVDRCAAIVVRRSVRVKCAGVELLELVNVLALGAVCREVAAVDPRRSRTIAPQRRIR